MPLLEAIVRDIRARLVRRGALGPRGERYAARWLKRRGYRIVGRNVHVGDDEADLVAIAPDGRTLVIVEVKTRVPGGRPPEDDVTPAKQRRLARLARGLVRDARLASRPVRFDVIAIEWEKQGPPEVRHYVAAFDDPGR